MRGLTIASKSPWVPSIRREHHFATLAARKGYPVTFIEQPSDIRSAAHGWRSFLAGLDGEDKKKDGVNVVRRSVIVPGHKGRVPQVLDDFQLRRTIARHRQPTVGYLPWQFAATDGAPRRIFDCTDDWYRLYPAKSHANIRAGLDRITAEADAIIVVNPTLARHFPGRSPVVVPNGVDRSAVLEQAIPKPGANAMAFVGTLSERFDANLVAAILRALPAWRLDIYGSCAYTGLGDRPHADVVRLLDMFAGRITLHGPIERNQVNGVLDRADVLIAPHDSSLSEGQSSMKLLDAAARGRPAVVSPGVTVDGVRRPPGTLEAATIDEWQASVVAAATESAAIVEERLAWAQSNTWDDRWMAWGSTVFGSDEGGGLDHEQ